MYVLLVFLIPLLILSPLVFCLIALRFVFPKHTLKINQTWLIPMGIPLLLFVNRKLLFPFIKHIPDMCVNTDYIVERILYYMKYLTHEQYNDIILNCSWFYIRPVLITWLFCSLLRKSWELSIENPSGKTWYSKPILGFFNYIGEKTGEIFLNHMGQLTAYPRNTELMIDVFTPDGYLFCGKFYEYFIDSEGNFKGICLTNAIRYRITHNPTTGDRINTDAYIVPNQGKMFFSSDKINNFHMWHLNKGHTFISHLATEKEAITLAWFVSIQWALSQTNMNIAVKVIGNAFPKNLVDKFTANIAKLNIPPKDIKISFVEK